MCVFSGHVYVEMACNGVFGEGNNGVINPPKLDKTYALSQVELAVMDANVFHLIKDLEVLTKLAKVRVMWVAAQDKGTTNRDLPHKTTNCLISVI